MLENSHQFQDQRNCQVFDSQTVKMTLKPSSASDNSKVHWVLYVYLWHWQRFSYVFNVFGITYKLRWIFFCLLYKHGEGIRSVSMKGSLQIWLPASRYIVLQKFANTLHTVWKQKKGSFTYELITSQNQYRGMFLKRYSASWITNVYNVSVMSSLLTDWMIRVNEGSCLSYIDILQRDQNLGSDKFTIKNWTRPTQIIHTNWKEL